ncbi:adhesin [Rickettsia bellii]|uniref:Putative adhesin n=1 Tax=Rickettsia bellii str. RML An4 TaxID=1359193 RepID=A0A0F3QDR6_RICBE|nr:outer membrane protein [Rickettsia bellii]ARD86189.1 adhesin [Rickettsia bellii]KJV90301.1 putative adhesin [Rickettsia bellii str. RML An4]
MKKLLLIAATSATVLSSALSFADCGNDSWYLRVDAGAAMFNKEKDNQTGLKLKSNTAFTGDIGVGNYIAENFRADLTLGTTFSGKLKKSGAVSSLGGANISASHKPNITRLLINGYVDLSNFEMFDVFAGAGIGASMLKEKVSFSGINSGATVSTSYSSKNTTNLAYKLTLGASSQISDGVKAELAYSWISDGKTKGGNVNLFGLGNKQVKGTRYQSHNLTAGLRFDI